MTRTNARGSVRRRQPEEKGGGREKPADVVPVQIPRHIVEGLPLLYRALCEVMVRDGFVQLVSDDTQSDEREH
ncbi:MAG: hypothetical protein ABSB80_03445 [Methanoregula sp.]|uniref:hypothetical protein n=1 Tax=Methanoregula sp. TaxID=2052170 RepID=UPI003D09E7E1